MVAPTAPTPAPLGPRLMQPQAAGPARTDRSHPADLPVPQSAPVPGARTPRAVAQPVPAGQALVEAVPVVVAQNEAEGPVQRQAPERVEREAPVGRLAAEPVAQALARSSGPAAAEPVAAAVVAAASVPVPVAEAALSGLEEAALSGLVAVPEAGQSERVAAVGQSAEAQAARSAPAVPERSRSRARRSEAAAALQPTRCRAQIAGDERHGELTQTPGELPRRRGQLESAGAGAAVWLGRGLRAKEVARQRHCCLPQHLARDPCDQPLCAVKMWRSWGASGAPVVASFVPPGLGYDATNVADDIKIRPGTPADLQSVGRVWRESATEDDDNPPRIAAVPSLYDYELRNRDLSVLELDGEVVAFAAVINRGEIAFLADLFVSANYQSRRLGQRLLQHVLPPAPRTCCTVSSNDPRALPLYARFGMLPTWPQLQLFGDLPNLRLDNLRLDKASHIEVIEADLADPELIRWDEQLSGRRRPQDLAYWGRHRGGVPLWFTRGGATLGYGVAQTRSDDLLESPETISLGPIGSRDTDDAAGCVVAAVRWARAHGDRARISITGPHPALPILLDAGFRIGERETFCFRGDQPFIDPRRYVSSGGDLF